MIHLKLKLNSGRFPLLSQDFAGSRVKVNCGREKKEHVTTRLKWNAAMPSFRKKTLPTQLENSLICIDLSNLRIFLTTQTWMSCLQVSGERFSEKSDLQEDLGIPLVPQLGRKTKTKKKLQCQCGGWRSKYRPCDSWSSFHSFHLCRVFWGKKLLELLVTEPSPVNLNHRNSLRPHSSSPGLF